MPHDRAQNAPLGLVALLAAGSSLTQVDRGMGPVQAKRARGEAPRARRGHGELDLRRITNPDTADPVDEAGDVPEVDDRHMRHLDHQPALEVEQEAVGFV